MSAARFDKISRETTNQADLTSERLKTEQAAKAAVAVGIAGLTEFPSSANRQVAAQPPQKERKDRMKKLIGNGF